MSVLHRSLRKTYPIAVRGKGVYLWDAAGHKYLDFSGSAAVNLIGHGNRKILRSVLRQAEKIEFVHTSQFNTGVAEKFADEVLHFCGPAFNGGKVFFTCGGSEAVETAIKLARQYQVESGFPKRNRIVSRQQAYHGATLGALAASGNKRRRDVYVPLVKSEAFVHIGMPYCYRCAYKCNDCGRKYAKELELALNESKGGVAAFLAEPMSGATLGAVFPPEGYFERVAELCRTHGALFVADEVMTGWGRTGKNLAMHHFDDEAMPDVVVLAKGLTSGYLPLGAVVVKKSVVDALEKGSGSFMHGFTYNAHPLAVAAGHAVFQAMKKERLVQRAAALEGSMRRELEKLLDCASVGDVRGKGLLWAVEFLSDKKSKMPFAPEMQFAPRVAEASARRGVLVYPMQGCVDGMLGDHLLLAPPAIITRDEIASAAATLREAIEEAERA
ncbi:MAG: aspartate aminotransferase family protein [Acidobacteriales bacterium]|nr:aspartate aminotransferase family protein [Terriglobales bacterium]